MLRHSFYFLLITGAVSFVIPSGSSNFNNTNASIHARDSTDPNQFVVLPMKYEIYGGAGQDAGVRPGASVDDMATAAANFLQNKARSGSTTWMTGAGLSRIGRSDLYTIVHLYRTLGGIPTVNSPGHVVFRNSDSKVMAIAYDSLNPLTTGRGGVQVDNNKVFSGAERQFGGLHRKDDTLRTNLWYASGPTSILWVASAEVRDDNFQAWRQAFYEVTTDKIVGSANYQFEAGWYKALKLPKLNPDDGFDRVEEGSDKSVSPDGWHFMPGSGQPGLGEVINWVEGNNVWSFMPHEKNNQFPDGLEIAGKTDDGPGFNYGYDTSRGADASMFAVSVNVFQLVNDLHDITYRYGYSDSMFNFQWWNIPSNKIGGDSIEIVSTPNGGPNTFSIPPEGHQPRMWLTTGQVSGKPSRHAGVDNTIVAHEFAHGMISRLTGGGTSLCMQSDVGRGMAEGWADAFAFWVGQKERNVREVGIGSWMADRPQGIRRFRYSPSKSTNGLTYSSWKSSNGVHEQGEVFAQMLVQLYGGLVDKHGFNADARNRADLQEGNAKWLHLFMDSLMIQPCNPSLQDVRNAFLQADQTRYNGDNRCVIWNAFAARGLGVNADNFNDVFDAPQDCQTGPPPVTTTTPPPHTTTQPPPTTTQKPTPTPTPTTTTGPSQTADPACPFWFPSCSEW